MPTKRRKLKQCPIGDKACITGNAKQLREDEPESVGRYMQFERERFLKDRGSSSETLAGRTPGIIPEGTRQGIRESVKALPGALELGAEITPSAIGAIGGAALMGPVPIPGARVAGAVGGGMLGEFLGQKLGITPESDLNLALTGAGGGAGPAVGGALRFGRKVTGKVAGVSPPFKVASGTIAGEKATKELHTLGARLLSPAKRSASDIFNVARKSGLKISGKRFQGTIAKIDEFKKSLQLSAGFPEVKAAISNLDAIARALSGRRSVSTLSPKQLKQFEAGKGDIIRMGQGGNTNFSLPDDLTFDTLLTVRQQLGANIGKAERAAGVRLGTGKRIFAQFNDDLDRIAEGVVGPARARIQRIAKVAIKRAKLEFAVKDLDNFMVRFSKVNNQGDVIIDVKGLLKKIGDITNKKGADFDKNFVAALGNNIRVLKKNLAVVVKNTNIGSPGGPGSLVVRGRLIGAVTGGLAGIGLSGPLVGGVAALGAAQIPEMLTALLLSPKGSRMLTKITELGAGEISYRRWILMSQSMVGLVREK